MSIPVHVSAVRVFDDRVDLVVRGAEGVLVNLRLSREGSLHLSGALFAAAGDGDGPKAVPATLDHPPAPAVTELRPVRVVRVPRPPLTLDTEVMA